MIRANAFARLAGAALLAVLAVAPVSAQYSIGTGVEYQSFDFDDGLGADRAQLLLVPVAGRFVLPSVEGLSLDVYSAWAEGRVQVENQVLKLSGPVDTGVRAAYQVTAWGLITLGANIPTGNSQHDSEEALVASVMSADLFGFREATWGRGFAVTSSAAVARQVSGFGLGLAVSYSLRSAFNPTADDNPATTADESALEYQPGSEGRVRVGVDRNFGNSTLTLGATFINYTEDQADGRNLFQAGNRLRFDGSYAFRVGGGVWTVYAADLIRQNGDLSLAVLDTSGDTTGVALTQTPSQNLLLGGVTGHVSLGGGFVFRPHLDGRLLMREAEGGSKAGSGWLVGMGGDIPMRIFGQDFFPKARVLLGKMKDPDEIAVGIFGLEFGGTMRFNF
jgi:hypothetical protein